MLSFEYARAESAAGAIDLARRGVEPRYLGGGTNLVDLMRENIERPRTVIDVTGLSRTIDTALTLAALDRALTTRQPDPGLIHHSDRGSQYASGAYQQLLARGGVIASMSRVGDCWDNAPVESFFAGLKRKAMPEAAGRAGPSPSAPSRTTSISTTGAGCTPPTTTAVRWTPKPRLASRYDSTQPVHRIDPGSEYQDRCS